MQIPIPARLTVRGLLSPVAAAVFAAVLFSAMPARADDAPGNDEVTLKTGGTIRGTVIESEPGVSVRMRVMGEKDLRIIPWAEVGEVVRDKYATKADAAGASREGGGSAQAPVPDGRRAEPALGAPGVVRLHVQSSKPVVVHAHSTTTISEVPASAGFGVGPAYVASDDAGYMLDKQRAVCASPCDKIVDGSSGRDFSVGGESVPESGWFSLAGRTGDVTVDVSPGSFGLRQGGYALLSLGGAGIAGGAALMFVGATQSHIEPMGKLSTGNSGLVTAGGAILGAGVATVVGAIVMLVESRTGVVLQSTGAGSTREVSRAPRYWAGEF